MIGGTLALSVLCLLLIAQRGAATTSPELARNEPVRSETQKTEEKRGGFWAQVRDTFREARTNREPTPPARNDLSVQTLTSARGNLLIHAPASAACGLLASLALVVTLPGLATLIARRRERAPGVPQS